MILSAVFSLTSTLSMFLYVWCLIGAAYIASTQYEYSVILPSSHHLAEIHEMLIREPKPSGCMGTKSAIMRGRSQRKKKLAFLLLWPSIRRRYSLYLGRVGDRAHVFTSTLFSTLACYVAFTCRWVSSLHDIFFCNVPSECIFFHVSDTKDASCAAPNSRPERKVTAPT